MEWKLEYSVGDEDLDRDHMSILNALDRVKKAQKNNLGDDFIGILLTQLVEYVDGHFAKEEEYMAKIGFPGLAEHHDRHVEMKAELIRQRGEFLKDGKANFDELTPFLNDWWEKHILEADMDYKLYAESNL